jgi:TetR/AcrR family acrAB operon transcriptional repressor
MQIGVAKSIHKKATLIGKFNQNISKHYAPHLKQIREGIIMARKTKAEAEQTRQEIVNAARAVFHQCGVSRTSLEHVAKVAGVTRGAIYWHFANKAALFYAMCEESSKNLDPARDFLTSDEFANPLDAIERSMLEFFETVERTPLVRQTYEIMLLRCEYVDEFAPVLQEVNKPCFDFLARLKTVYSRAAEKGYLRHSLDPEAMAYDTLSFTTGLFNNWLAGSAGDHSHLPLRTMIRNHMALRRRDA